MNGVSDLLVPRKKIGIKNDKYCTFTIYNMHVCTQRIPYSRNSIHFTEIPPTMYLVVCNYSYVVSIKLCFIEICPIINKGIKLVRIKLVKIYLEKDLMPEPCLPLARMVVSTVTVVCRGTKVASSN